MIFSPDVIAYAALIWFASLALGLVCRFVLSVGDWLVHLIRRA